MTMAGGWSYNENATYKPTRDLIHYLVNIVSKGGNYLLNIGPSPEGDFDPVAYERLREIGDWMQINGDAIYGTRPVGPYSENNLRFTAKGDNVFAIYLASDVGSRIPDSVQLESFAPRPASEIYLLGSDEPLSWSTENAVTRIEIPESVRNTISVDHAWVFRIKVSE
jgi:alpha-L-fucosidase